MMGKIIGIGAVGLTQFLIWIILIGTLSTVFMSLIPADVMHQVQQAQEGNPGAMQSGSETVQNMATIQANLSTVNWGKVIAVSDLC